MKLLGKGESRTFFDIIGTLHDSQRGRHFCSLGPIVTIGIDFVVRDEAYLPTTGEPWKGYERLGSHLKFKLDNLPPRLEHLLQVVRHEFPGIGFQFVVVHLDEFSLTFTGDSPDTKKPALV